MPTDHVEPAVPGGECEREPGPSDSLRMFGAVVQALREHAGLSRVQFGEMVRFSQHTVESVELGRRMPDAYFVERAEAALGNTGALRHSARFLTRGEAGLAVWFRRWAKLEREAVSLCTYECRLAPGLLRSPGICAGAVPIPHTAADGRAAGGSGCGEAGQTKHAGRTAARSLPLHRRGGRLPAQPGWSRGPARAVGARVGAHSVSQRSFAARAAGS